jgi:hypothetical protein
VLFSSCWCGIGIELYRMNRDRVFVVELHVPSQYLSDMYDSRKLLQRDSYNPLVFKSLAHCFSVSRKDTKTT